MEKWSTYRKCNLCGYEGSLAEIKSHIQIPRRELQLLVGSTFKYKGSRDNRSLIFGYLDSGEWSLWSESHFKEAKFILFDFHYEGHDEWDIRLENTLRRNQMDTKDSNEIYNLLFNNNFSEFSDKEWDYVQERLKKTKLDLPKFPLIRGVIPKEGDLYKIINS